MAKSTRKQAESAVTNRSSSSSSKKGDSSLFKISQKALDPNLASLFASSAGPVTAPPKSRYQDALPKHDAEEEVEEEGEGSSEDDDDDDTDSNDSSEDVEDEEMASGSDPDSDSDSNSSPDDEEATPSEAESISQDKPTKKRKRGDKDGDLEDTYLQKLAREEAKDEEKRKKKQKMDEPTKEAQTEETSSDADSESDSGESFTVPRHETQLDTHDAGAEELEKAARTVFLGNVSSEAIISKPSRKQLKQHLSSFIPDLADTTPPHKLESLRFRSVAFSSSLPKRAAFAKKEIMDTTTKSTNAYAVYSTTLAAREAVKRLNGSVILNRHLRVDSVAHPQKIDHRRCVFVGNLGFVDDESAAKADADDDDPSKKKKSNKPASDVEEGLWLQFSKAGKVESVRVPRDAQTRVGKGFAYVQFEDETAVEAALQFNEQKFPPLLPRKLRVTRARAQKKNHKANTDRRGPAPSSTRSKAGNQATYNPKVPSEQKSQQGRARAVLGKAAAFKSAEAFVFEGHRASSRQGHSGLKLGGKGGSKGARKKGPNGRRERSRAWKANGNGKK